MATKKEVLKQSQEAIGEFFKLAKYLFGDDAPYDINEIPEDSPFYERAKSISDEMELDWQGMLMQEESQESDRKITAMSIRQLG